MPDQNSSKSGTGNTVGLRRWRWLVVPGLVIILLHVLSRALFRPLWYDEALTLLEFVGQDSFGFICRNYPIPNNHIAYNLLLLAWTRVTQLFLPLGDFSFRLCGTVLAVASGLAMQILWRQRTGQLAAALTVICLALSPAFAIYGTAVRGYQLGFLAVLLALESGRRWRDGGPRWLGVAYFAASLLAVATMPTNLLALAAIPLLPDRPPTPGNVLRPRRLWLAVAPLLAFALFYLPIAGQLRGVMALKEGWGNAAAAMLHFYAAFGLMALPLLVFAIPGLAAWWSRRTPWALACGAAVFLLPAAAMLARSPAPFPRTFYPFWPVWLYLLALGLQAGQATLRRRARRPAIARVLYVLTAALLLAASLPGTTSQWLSNVLTPRAAQDDYFHPYFMDASFRPHVTIEKALMASGGNSRNVFLHPGADPLSLIYYGRMRLGPQLGEWLHDRPGRPVTFAVPPRHLAIVARDQAQADSLTVRFRLRNLQPFADCGYHRIYLAEGTGRPAPAQAPPAP